MSWPVNRMTMGELEGELSRTEGVGPLGPPSQERLEARLQKLRGEISSRGRRKEESDDRLRPLGIEPVVDEPERDADSPGS